MTKQPLRRARQRRESNKPSGGEAGSGDPRHAKRSAGYDPPATRAAILAAAQELIARDGPELLSVARVAQLAGVNRGTVYQHFNDREELVHAAVERFTEQLDRVLLPADANPKELADRFDDEHLEASTRNVVDFVMANSELCRVWLFDVLSSARRRDQHFGHHLLDAFRDFAKTDLARPGVDSEIFAMILLTPILIWPVWVDASRLDDSERRKMTNRFVREIMRLNLLGSLRPELYPKLVASLLSGRSDNIASAGRKIASKNARDSKVAGRGEIEPSFVDISHDVLNLTAGAPPGKRSSKVPR